MPLDKILQELQAVASAFLGVELNRKDIIPCHSAGKGDAILGRTSRQGWIDRLNTVAMDKIET